MSSPIASGGVRRAVEVFWTPKPIYLRNGGADENDGRSVETAVATFNRAVELFEHDRFGIRQYIEATGYVGDVTAPAVGTSNYFNFPDGLTHVGADFTREGAFDSGKLDFNNMPIEVYADPTLVLTIDIVSYSADSVSTLQIINVSDTLVVDAHVGQWVGTGGGVLARIASNTENTITIASSAFSETGAHGIYTESCVLSFNDAAALSLDSTALFTGVRFSGTNAPFFLATKTLSFTNCSFDIGISVAGYGMIVTFINCHTQGWCFIEGMAQAFSYSYFDGVDMSSHGSGGYGKNAYDKCIFNNCPNLGGGNFESCTDIEIQNCLITNAPSSGVWRQSPYACRISNVRINDSASHAISLTCGGGYAKIRDVSGTGNGGYGIAALHGTQVEIQPTVDITGTLGDVLLGDRVIPWATFNALSSGESLNDLLETFPQFCRLFK